MNYTDRTIVFYRQNIIDYPEAYAQHLADTTQYPEPEYSRVTDARNQDGVAHIIVDGRLLSFEEVEALDDEALMDEWCNVHGDINGWLRYDVWLATKFWNDDCEPM